MIAENLRNSEYYYHLQEIEFFVQNEFPILRRWSPEGLFL